MGRSPRLERPNLPDGVLRPKNGGGGGGTPARGTPRGSSIHVKGLSVAYDSSKLGLKQALAGFAMYTRSCAVLPTEWFLSKLFILKEKLRKEIETNMVAHWHAAMFPSFPSYVICT